MSAQPLHITPSTAKPRLAAARIFVRAIRLDVEIGIYGHEYGRTQPLVIDVEVEMKAETQGGFEHIADTVNYERIVGHAQALAAEGHFKLVETFAERLAHACLEDPLAARVRVRVEKPEALAPAAEAAGVELVVER
jgi:dihydroneopterin aldolase